MGNTQPSDTKAQRTVGRPRRPELDALILDATLAELARVGYARMNVEHVARLAGTTKPTVYTRFPSKAELATVALERLRQRTTRRPLSTNTRQDLIDELALFRSGALKRNGISILGSVLAEEHENPNLLRLFRKHVVLPRRDNLRRILEHGRKLGQISQDADLDLAITMLVGSLYAGYLAGKAPHADWPANVVDAWLEQNRE